MVTLHHESPLFKHCPNCTSSAGADPSPMTSHVIINKSSVANDCAIVYDALSLELVIVGEELSGPPPTPPLKVSQLYLWKRDGV